MAISIPMVPDASNKGNGEEKKGRTYMVAAPAGPSRISVEAVTVLYVRVRVDGFFDEGAVWSPATVACLAMIEQLGLFVAPQRCSWTCNALYGLYSQTGWISRDSVRVSLGAMC